MGFSGYSSAHWPPGRGSESSRWHLMPSSPSSNTWNRPQGPAPTMTTSVCMVMGEPGSGAAGVRIRGRVVVLAVGRQLADQALELLHAGLGRADGQAVLAAGVAARLPGVQPVLHGASQQAIRDVPQVGVLVLVRQL